MFEKLHPRRADGRSSLKQYVAYVLFGAIILVFAFFGIHPNDYGGDTGGAAAVVNDTPISIAEYRSRVESIEENAKGRFGELPAKQRQDLTNELRRRALDELILSEIVYQAAQKKGVLAADGEVRDYILGMDFLKQNGRFMKDRYQAFLQNMNLSSDDFERQIRKQIVNQKLQDLFIGSAAPSREELKRSRTLASQKINIRFAEINQADLEKPGVVSEEQVKTFAQSNAAEVKKYYDDNKIEFTQPEKVKARHILLRVDDKRNEAATKKLAEELKAKATPANFATLATQNSDDPGSKAKGGDLGEFERGRMLPEFENAAFALNEGEIGQPLKTQFGYHLIFTEKKSPTITKTLDQVSGDIARKLLVRGKQTEILAPVKVAVESGNKSEADRWLQKAGLKWQDSGEFDLGANAIPKVVDSNEVMRAVLKAGKAGFVPQLVAGVGRHYLVDVTGWKQTGESAPEVEGSDRMVAYRKSGDLIETWAKEVQEKAHVTKNPQLLR